MIGYGARLIIAAVAMTLVLGVWGGAQACELHRSSFDRQQVAAQGLPQATMRDANFTPIDRPPFCPVADNRAAVLVAPAPVCFAGEMTLAATAAEQ